MSADCLTFEKMGRKYLITDDDIYMPDRTMKQVRQYIEDNLPGTKLPGKLDSFYYNYSSGYLSINGKVIERGDEYGDMR